MRPLVCSSIGLVLACTALAGCQRAADTFSSAGAGHGRYVGVGHFAPDRMWAQIVRPADKTNPGAAKPSDDEQIIVVMDSVTGEVRQCGNLSGQCVGMNPWAKPLPPSQTAPVALAKHAEDLDREDPAQAAKAP